jgi:hypothetical protein
MAYRTIDENRVPSGIVFFGPTAADQTFESNSSLIFDSGTETLYVNNLNIDGTLTGAGGSINVSGDTGTSEVVALGDTLKIFGGNGISTVSSATDTITISLVDGGVTEDKISRSVGTYNATASITHDIALATAGAGGITLTLPTAASGLMTVVKKVDAAEGVVTVVGGGSVEVDGSVGGKGLYYQWETMTFVSDSTDWYVI